MCGSNSVELENAFVTKDPDERVDFVNDWANRLPSGDTIVSSVWEVPAGITGSDESSTTTTTTIWLEGGTLGVEYHLVNRITTVQGRIQDRSKYVTIESN